MSVKDSYLGASPYTTYHMDFATIWARGQWFVASSSYDVTSVDIYVKRFSGPAAPGTVTVAICEVSGNLPGAVLDSATFNGNDLFTAYTWQSVNLSASLTSGTRYCITVIPTAWGLVWAGDSAPAYTGSTQWDSSGGPTWNSLEIGADQRFRVNGTSAASNWIQVAPMLDSQKYVFSLIEFNEKLYGGTFPGGRLFEWNDVNAWVQKATQAGGDQIGIWSLVVLGSDLYGGTSLGGKLFKWNGSNAWIQVAGQLNSQQRIYSLVVLNGEIYGGTYPGGRLFKWNGVNAWIQVAGQLNSQNSIHSLIVLTDEIYGSTGTGGRLFKWNGSNAWDQVAGQLNGQANIHSLCVLDGKIYGGTNSGGRLFEWNGTDAWVQVADQSDSETDILSLIEANSGIYGGTYPSGKLLKWNGTNAWIEMADQLNDQTHVYALADFNSEIYGGTRHVSDGGRLFSFLSPLPAKAVNPTPTHEDTDIRLSWPTLTWEAG